MFEIFAKYLSRTGTRTLFFVLSAILAVAALPKSSFSADPSPGASPAHGSVRVLYNLDRKRDDQEIIALIDAAKTRIDFAMYVFTLRDIADALVAAKHRGVLVRGLLDARESASDYEAPIVAELRRAGIPVETERHADGYGIMHIKAIVTDSGYAVGSYNWTLSGTRENDELLEIGTDPALVAAYRRILERLFALYTRHPAVASRRVAPSLAVYDFTQAPTHIGERASVRGRLIDAYRSARGTVFLDFCANYKGCSFSGVIFADDAGKFGRLSRYVGRTVSLTGVISSYRGRAEIKLSAPDQLAASD
jgi:PLD-like domain